MPKVIGHILLLKRTKENTVPTVRPISVQRVECRLHQSMFSPPRSLTPVSARHRSHLIPSSSSDLTPAIILILKKMNVFSRIGSLSNANIVSPLLAAFGQNFVELDL